ncbi:hypothetical protein F7U66_00540 [Vibrio parahaemolyticus]|nr:hypothetical protein [Vibrio parahaemolyticus]
MQWTDHEDFISLDGEKTAELIAIPLLLKRGLPLDYAINSRKKASVAIWECAQDEFDVYYKNNRKNSRDSMLLFERLERRGFYAEKYDFEGYTLVNPWDFV